MTFSSNFQLFKICEIGIICESRRKEFCSKSILTLLAFPGSFCITSRNDVIDKITTAAKNATVAVPTDTYKLTHAKQMAKR